MESKYDISLDYPPPEFLTSGFEVLTLIFAQGLFLLSKRNRK